MPVYNPTDSRYLVVAQTRTRNGQTDIKIVLDLISNEFYTLDDDGNFNLIAGGGGSQNLSQVLNQGNSTGNNTIQSPDTLSQLGILDGQIYFTLNDIANYQSYMVMQPYQTTFNVYDILTANGSSILMGSNGVSMFSTFNSGLSTNTIIASNVNAALEHFTFPSQSQRIFVDASTANMKYEDGINIIDVELGLTNGFRARQTISTNDFENYIQVKFDRVIMSFNDVPGGINFEHRIDADGYFLKNLPAYQDDAAAGTAGLPQGYIYQTDGTGAAPLDVAGIVMIKQ